MTESTFSHTPQSTSSRLVIEALEAGADQARPLQDAAADSSRMTVELSDIRAWRFFEAAPQDFLHQYAGDFVIADVHLAPSFFEQALDFLHAEPQAHLCLRGRFSRRKLLETIDAAKAQSISVEVHEGAGLRALAAHIETQSSTANNPDSASLNPASGLVLRELAFAHPCADEGSAVRSIADIYGAGPGSTSSQSQRFSAQAWTNFFKQLWFEDLAPTLRLRDRSSFFSYMKALARQTSKGLNWAKTGEAASISAPTARDWTKHLESIGLCELIEPLRAPAPRRAKLRPKLYWTTPGLALWLADSMLHPTEDFAAALVENALYLALKDALPSTRFLHFVDTNGITAPIVVENEGLKTAFFLVRDEKERLHAAKSLKSLAKAAIVSPQAQVLFWDYSDSSVLRTETLCA